MGCECIFECSNINNDLSLEVTSDPNYREYKKKSNKNNKEIIIRSLIDDYKALNKNSTKIKFHEKNVEKNFRKIQIPKKSQLKKEINNNIRSSKNSTKRYINSNRENNTTQDIDNVENESEINNNNKESIKNPKIKKIKIKKTHPERITYLKDITKDSFSYFYLDNTFIVFTSVQNILTLIYATKEKSIISFDLIENKKINAIKGAHKELITNFRHIQDIKNKRDLVISISYDSNIKLWDYTNLECLTDIENIYENGYLFSSCFLNNKDNIYIITSNYSENNDILKVYDLTGNKIMDINDSFGSTNFIDIYYDKKKKKNYIITGNIGCVKSFDFNENKLYHVYSEEDFNDHCSVIINSNQYTSVVKMIESSGDGIVRIWNFHTNELLKKIIIYKKRILGICLWSNNYLFIGCEDKTIKLLEIKSEEIVNNLFGNNSTVLNIKKINHPKYGECLISQGAKDNQIKLWIKKIKKKKKKLN